MAKKITLQYTGNFDPKQIINSLDEIYRKANSLNIKDSFSKNLLSGVANLKKQVLSVSSQLEKGFSSQSSIDKLQNDIVHIVNSFENLRSSLNNIDLKDLNVDPAYLKNIQSYSNELKEINSELRKVWSQSANVSKTTAALSGKDIGSGAGSFTKALAGALDDTEKINELFSIQEIKVRSVLQEEQNKREEIEKQIQLEKQRLELIDKFNKSRSGNISNQDKDFIEKISGKTMGKRSKVEGLELLQSAGDEKTLSKLEKERSNSQKQIIILQEQEEKRLKNLVEYRDKINKLVKEQLELEKQLTGKSESLQGKMQAETQQILNEVKSKVNANISPDVDTARVSIDELRESTANLGQQYEETLEKEESFNRVTENAKSILGAAGAYKILSSMVRTAWQDIRELDKEFTGIAVVTEKTTSQLWETFGTYNEMAQRLGVTAADAARTSKLYYQQGLDTADVMTLTEETIKMATIAELDFATATDQMTAAIRGFKLEMSEASRVNDVFSSLAAEAAVDTQEVAYALTKTASIAQSAGMELETTSAFLTQMIETTR